MSTELDNVDPWETGDHLTAEGLNERSGGGIRSISTGGNLRHTQTGNHVDLYVPPSTAGAPAAAAALTHFRARLTDAQKMMVPTIKCIELPNDTTQDASSRGVYSVGAPFIAHPYRWRYSFVEVSLVEEPKLSDPGYSGQRWIDYEDKPAEAGGREGRWQWPDDGLPASKKWAFNIWEMLHKQEEEICPTFNHWVFGAAINGSSYPPNFAPHGTGTGAGSSSGYYRNGDYDQKSGSLNDVHGKTPGSWADNQDFMVLMYETTDKYGSLIRYFNAPGMHLGGCLG